MSRYYRVGRRQLLRDLRADGTSKPGRGEGGEKARSLGAKARFVPQSLAVLPPAANRGLRAGYRGRRSPSLTRDCGSHARNGHRRHQPDDPGRRIGVVALDLTLAAASAGVSCRSGPETWGAARQTGRALISALIPSGRTAALDRHEHGVRHADRLVEAAARGVPGQDDDRDRARRARRPPQAS